MLCLSILGCTPQSSDPKKVLTDILSDKNINYEILYQKEENGFYLSLVKENEITSLVILKETEAGYQYFGESEYENTKCDYGKYVYGDDNTLVIVFSENKNSYSQISLDYINISNQNEILSINTDVSHESYILHSYILPSKYDFQNMNIE